MTLPPSSARIELVSLLQMISLAELPEVSIPPLLCPSFAMGSPLTIWPTHIQSSNHSNWRDNCYLVRHWPGALRKSNIFHFCNKLRCWHECQLSFVSIWSPCWSIMHGYWPYGIAAARLTTCTWFSIYPLPNASTWNCSDYVPPTDIIPRKCTATACWARVGITHRIIVWSLIHKFSECAPRVARLQPWLNGRG